MGALSGFFSRNWTLKLSAFGVALLLWVAVRAEAPNRQEVSAIPIRVDLADPEWALDGTPSPASVTVRFGGPSRELIRMAVDRPSIVVPLDEVNSADTAVVLSNAWVRIQGRQGVVVEEILPRAVRITLQPVERMTLPAAPRFEGDLPDDLALAGAPQVVPSEIRVIGPRNRIAEIDSVPLTPADLSGIVGSGRVLVQVDTTALPGVNVQPLTAEVDFRVEDRIERVVSGIPIVLPEELQDFEGLVLRPATASVIVRGARSVVEGADPTRFRMVARLESSDVPEPGGEAEFPIYLEGLPALLQAEIQQSVVTVANESEEPAP
ncbi:MAG: CdaR family protein [Gemmatimonadota bacterium]